MKWDIKWWQVIALVILVIGAFLTVGSAQHQDQLLRTNLLTKTQIAQTGISPEQVASLTGSAADLASPEYLALKKQLERIRAADPDIRFAYLMGLRSRTEQSSFMRTRNPWDQRTILPPDRYTLRHRLFSERCLHRERRQPKDHYRIAGGLG